MVNHLLKEVKDVPWKVKEVMDQRIEFVARAVSKEKNSERVVPGVRD